MSDDEAETLAQIHAVNSHLSSNREVMDAITAEIKAGNTNKTELITAVNKLTLVSKVKVKRTLDDHTGTKYKDGHRWNYIIKDKNCHIYTLIDPESENTYRRLM